MPTPEIMPNTEPRTPQQTETTLRTAGQRRINIIWEYTQAMIAGTISVTVLGVAAILALRPETQVGAFVFLTGAANLVIGFYFGRTNHARPTAMLEREHGE